MTPAALDRLLRACDLLVLWRDDGRVQCVWPGATVSRGAQDCVVSRGFSLTVEQEGRKLFFRSFAGSAKVRALAPSLTESTEVVSA